MTSEEEARKHLSAIKAYWAERGHKIRGSVELVKAGGNKSYSVVTDMIDGLPRTMKRGA